ncbi:prepilin-type N-terminal cleavage/methylation domain-containing protein [Thioalkalivibrio sp. ALE28]|uniref:type IV pilus modification PilV family protein n=1 Tax=Thioalkalivibrio sp. ALE28 TaxID=1158179 RepID=UPI000360943F|nr:prepilin-type N-terminal cleavage/methylation domain-containing protein [Thioalkalivibrio sp. ALE28]
MNHDRKHYSHGISLIEALIALAVLGLGLLAIAKLHGELTGSTADSKARAEAMQIAESRMDALRNHLETGNQQGDTHGFAVVAAELEQDGIPGVNATFDVSVNPNPINTLAVFDPSDPDYQGYADVELEVTWTNSRGEQQSVTLSSAVAWNDPLSSINLARGRLAGENLIGSPSGAARRPGELIESADAEATTVLHGGDYEIREADGRFQLVDATENLPLLETRTPGFSTITGLLLAYDMDAQELNDIRVDLSDSGFCVNTRLEEGVPPGAEDNENNPHHTNINGIFYRCYVGVGWFGNIGVVNRDGGVTNIPNNVCVGDPTVDDVEAWNSREPQESLRRRYRGYDGNQAYGIGDGPDVTTPEVRHLGTRVPDDAPDAIKALFDEPGLYGDPFVPDDYVGHFFLLASTTGGNNNCQSRMVETQEEDPGHGVTWFEETTQNDYTGNSGQNYCFLEIDPIGGDCEPPPGDENGEPEPST